METDDKKEEIIKEFPFLSDNEKWGGKVQVIRVTVAQGDGTTRTFINKRLMFSNSRRYMNLPRRGIEEVTKAIEEATGAEQTAHESLLAEINVRPADRAGEKQVNPLPHGSNRRR